MIAVDTNILVYAHRKDSPWHEKAYKKLAQLVEGRTTWAIPWPCVHEFISICTHPKIFKPASSLEQALHQIEFWMESPFLRLINEGENYWDLLKKILVAGKIQGPMVHDMRIASICLESGVSELWSADRDFSRCRITVTNPLLK
jgi:predicted nucleic acid-binding protein